jgi:hypothetical protein
MEMYALSDAASNGFGDALASDGDANGDGFRDLLVGAPFAGSAGALFVYSGASAPQLQGLAVDRGDYRVSTDLTLLGGRFAQGDQLQVQVGPDLATNVTVVDDATITATICAGDPGPFDVTVQNTLGATTVVGGFRRTPAVLLEGDWVPGGHVSARHLFDPGDGVLTLLGYPPVGSFPTPPFLRERSIDPFWIVQFALPNTLPGDELVIAADLTSDPSLSGITVLVQALIGPVFSGPGRNATWSNCASVTIQKDARSRAARSGRRRRGRNLRGEHALDDRAVAVELDGGDRVLRLARVLDLGRHDGADVDRAVDLDLRLVRDRGPRHVARQQLVAQELERDEREVRVALGAREHAHRRRATSGSGGGGSSASAPSRQPPRHLRAGRFATVLAPRFERDGDVAVARISASPRRTRRDGQDPRTDAARR